MGGLSTRGDGYLRRLLSAWREGCHSIATPGECPRPLPWLAALLGRRPVNVAAAALANKNARIAWALLTRGEVYAASRQSLAAAQ
jgi:transposase